MAPAEEVRFTETRSTALDPRGRAGDEEGATFRLCITMEVNGMIGARRDALRRYKMKGSYAVPITPALMISAKDSHTCHVSTCHQGEKAATFDLRYPG